MCEKFNKELAKEIENGVEICIWIAFTGDEGSRGVVILMAFGPNHAIELSADLGINLSGYVEMFQVDPDNFKEEDFNRLLSKEDLIEAGYVDAPVLH